MTTTTTTTTTAAAPPDDAEARPYASADDHARDELALTGLFLRRAMARGRREGWVAGTSGISEDAAAVDAEIRAVYGHIEARLAAARRAGRAVPFDTLRTRLGLSMTEQRILWALVGHEQDPRLRHLLRCLATEPTTAVTTGVLVALLYQPDLPLEVRAFADFLEERWRPGPAWTRSARRRRG